jgi:uncharacterized membrane protein YhaH (DUF805 family)
MKATMGPLDAIKSGVRNTFQTSDRATRSEFWWFAGIGFAAICLIVYTATPTPFAETANDVDNFVPLAPFRIAIAARMSALPLPYVYLIGALSLMLFTAIVRRFNDLGWSRAASVSLVVTTLGVVTAFILANPDAVFLMFTKAAYGGLIGYDVSMETAIFLSLVFSPVLLMTLIADVFILVLGGLILTAVALTMTVILIGTLASSSAPAINSNEAPS